MSAYDDFAEAYVAHAARSIYNTRYERPAVQAALRDPRGKRVLDAACASGEHASMLIERGARVVGVDASTKLVAIARERLGDQAEVHRADLCEPLGFLGDASFDIVLSSLTLHYLADWHVPLAEFSRVLVPGGQLVLSTHHPAMTAALVRNYFETQLVDDVWKIAGKPTRVRYYHRPLEAIVRAVRDAGFAIDGLIEPRLTERSDDVRAKQFAALSTRPAFLILDAHAP